MAKTTSSKRRRASGQRRLATERLERRDLLAGVAYDAPQSHNAAHPEDTNGDGRIGVVDVVGVVSQIRNRGASDGTILGDVNGDGMVDPFDAVMAVAGVRRGGGASQAPMENRIARLEEALAAGTLPGDLTRDRALDILETLRHGGRPELGEEITPSRFEELRSSDSEWALAQELLAKLQESGVDQSRAKDWVQDIRDLFPDSETPIAELVGHLRSDDDSIGDLASRMARHGVAEGEAGVWVEQIDHYLSGDGGWDEIFADLRSDDLDALSDELLAALEAEGVDTETAQRWIEEFRQLTPAEGETRLQEVASRLSSEELDQFTDDLLAALQAEGVNTATAEGWIESFRRLVPDSDTPLADLFRRLRGPEIDQLARDVLVALAENGVESELATRLVDDIVEILPDTDNPIRDFLRQLRGENGDAVRAEVLAIFEANGVDTAIANQWIDDILLILPDSDTPLRDLLARLNNDPDQLADDVTGLLASRGVPVGPAQPWIDLGVGLFQAFRR